MLAEAFVLGMLEHCQTLAPFFFFYIIEISKQMLPLHITVKTRIEQIKTQSKTNCVVCLEKLKSYKKKLQNM